jgi:uncharacterized membrane protein YfcA
MEIAGYLSALLIGLSLGLIGGGGTILTVPVLLYLFKIDGLLAITYSLFIVGNTSLFGAFQKWRQGLIAFKEVGIFAIFSLITVTITRKFVLPLVPDPVFYIGESAMPKEILILVFFSMIMLAASYTMITAKTPQEVQLTDNDKLNIPAIAVQGIGIGLVTGFVGAGGGFLIVPALIYLLKLPVKKAMASSLLVIAINSFFGFLPDAFNPAIKWEFLLLITALAMTGIFAGSALAKVVPAARLKKGFGYFVLVMGLFVLVMELLKFYGKVK